MAIVALWPAGTRPFIDGSPDNNIFNLITGYNGLQRIFSGGGPGGGGGGANFSGQTGVLRLFNSIMGGQASWLLPAALLALVIGLWARRRAPRTDRTRAALLLWGGWLIVTAVVFSFSQGVIHTYYTVALAPAIGALVAIGTAMLWSHRERLYARAIAAAAVAGTGIWAYVLLDRTSSWQPWLRGVVGATTGLAVVGLLAAPALGRLWRRAGAATLAVAAVACLSGPMAYAADTIATPHDGSIPSAGPAVASDFGGGGVPGAGRSSARGVFGFAGAGGPPPGARPSGAFAPPGIGASGGQGRPRAGAFGGGPGGGAATTSKALVNALRADASRYSWVAAVGGSQTAASLELATGGDPVMAIGGFSGNGGNLTLSAFERYVAKGEIHYYIASGGGGGGGGLPGGPGGAPGAGARGGGGPAGGPGARSGSSTQIASWVKSHFKAITIGGQTVYDLTQRVS